MVLCTDLGFVPLFLAAMAAVQRDEWVKSKGASMKKIALKKVLSAVLIAALAFSFLVAFPAPGIADQSDYNTDDLNFVNGLIQQNASLTWDEWPASSTEAEPPADWAPYIIWDNSVPKRIVGLNLSDLGLTTLGTALPGGALLTLDISKNNITGLPDFPDTLIWLDVSENPLAGLPYLPADLVEFYCNDCGLTALPVAHPTTTLRIPSSLLILEARGNLLTGLPALPAGLQYLDVSNNQLTDLPDLPTTLLGLNVSNNALGGLPSLPAGLQELYASNIFSSTATPGLPPLPESLLVLDASENDLTGLPDLPAGLLFLDLHMNYLAGLPALPAGLLYLDLHLNNLPALPTLPSSLIYLNVMSNPIEVIMAVFSLVDYSAIYPEIVDYSGVIVIPEGNVILVLDKTGEGMVELIYNRNFEGGGNSIAQLRGIADSGYVFDSWTYTNYLVAPSTADNPVSFYVFDTISFNDLPILYITANFETDSRPTTPGTGDSSWLGLLFVAAALAAGATLLLIRRKQQPETL